MNLPNLTKTYAALGQIYDLGAAQLNRVIALASLITMIGVWKTTIQYYGLTVTESLIILLVGFPVAVFLVGYWYYRHGGMEKTVDMANKNNTEWQEHRAHSIEMDRKLNLIMNKLEMKEK